MNLIAAITADWPSLSDASRRAIYSEFARQRLAAAALAEAVPPRNWRELGYSLGGDVILVIGRPARRRREIVDPAER